MKDDKPKKYYGFEKWWQETRMSIKMYLYVFIILLIFHITIPLMYFWIFEEHNLKALFKIIFGLQFQYWDSAFEYFLKKGFLVFILATPIWILYPVLIWLFKKKAEKIIKTEWTRGSKLIADDELRKIILSDIKKQRRF